MEDADAIRRCREGDPDAFGHMVRRYQRQALGHARALTGNDADAADAAQSAFVDAFVHLGRFDETREFYPMVLRAATESLLQTTGALALPGRVERPCRKDRGGRGG